MFRPATAILLTVAALAPGCSSPQPLLPLDEDPSKLVDQIAQQGQGDRPLEAGKTQTTEEASPDRTKAIMAKTALIRFKVGATCAVVAVMMGLSLAAGPGGGSFAGLNLGAPFVAIWSL